MCESFFVDFRDELERIEVIRDFDVFHVFPSNDNVLSVKELTRITRNYEAKFMCYQIARTLAEERELYSVIVASQVWERYAFHLMQKYYENPPQSNNYDDGRTYDTHWD